LYAQAEGGQAINFAKPRQPRTVSKVPVRLLMTAALFLLVLLGGGYVLGQSIQKSRRAELQELEKRAAEVEKALKKAQEEGKHIKAVDALEGIVALDVLYDLCHMIPDLEALRVSQVTLEPVLRKTANSPYVARLIVIGQLRGDRKMVDKLIDE